ncbi:MAG: aminopeptidase [Acidobacteria bacterium]|nr:MAG: aminopeptidase [Acidobacteriota bacterium]
MFEEGIYRIYKTNMNLKEEESLLLLTDREKHYLVELMEDFINVAYSITQKVRYCIYPSLKMHGEEPPEEVWRVAFGDKAVDELKKAQLFHKVLSKDSYSEDDVIEVIRNYAKDVPHVVVAFPYYSTTHTLFRKLLTKVFGCRYASMPLFEPQMFEGPMDVDWNQVASISIDLADILTEGEWVHIKAEGTQLEFSIKDREGIADTGLFYQKGQYGNLPAGEAFIAPVEGSAFGKLTITYSPDRKLESPLVLKFRDGAVESVEGFDTYRRTLEDVFKRHDNARLLAEFGVGTNPMAKRPDNILEAEKIMGTIHLAIGDNHTFGGTNRVPFHTDYVVFEPEVTIGGRGWQKKLLEKGRLRI